MSLPETPLRAAPWLHDRRAPHSVYCPCQGCETADYDAQPSSRPTYALRFIAECWPEVDWLAWLPRSERLWYAAHGDELKRRFPAIPEEAWLKLLS